MLDQNKLDKILNKTANVKNIHGVVFCISTADGKFEWTGAAGNMTTKSPYYIASINKFFISALILGFIKGGRLSLNDKFSKFVSKNVIEGLHIYKGRDYSDDITIKHMLSQTSGLPCYLTDKIGKGDSVLKKLEVGIDSAWPIENVIGLVKKMVPHFPPGYRNKAKYIDTNHQLLNLVIENITGKDTKDVLNELFSELDMTDSYVCHDTKDESYVYPYYLSEKRNISNFLTSTHNDIISTVADQQKFIKAFFSGFFYPLDKLDTLKDWKAVFFPFHYGIGIQKFYMPRFMSPFGPVPDMIGHCGSTGAVAFYVPDRDAYITGTTNQQAAPGVSFRTIIQLINSMG